MNAHPGFRRLLASLAVVSLALGACDEEPSECKDEDQGAFHFVITPDLIDAVRTFTGTLDDVSEFISEPPLTRYTFTNQATGGPVTLDVRDFGYDLPLEEGLVYTVTAQTFDVDGTVIRGYGLTLSDGDGLLAFVVSDYEPQPERDAVIYEDGYPIEGLRVFTESGDCDPRVEDTVNYESVTNQRLQFVLSGASISLYHRESGTLGPWRVRVFRAQREVLKNPLLLGPQISFAVERLPIVP